MYKRLISDEICAMANVYPVVTLVGPRQSGKTTLIKSLFPNKPYVNLEGIEARRLAEADPEGFMEQYRQGAIFDEIQRAPHLLSVIQVMVDEAQQEGQFILTGSHQLTLHQAISQSLAGRTAVLKLWPLSLIELAHNALDDLSLDALLLHGGYPRIFLKKLEPYKFYSHYYETYLERDIRLMSNVKDLMLFQRFMRLCASRVGCTLNAVALANEVGISSPTVSQWLSILEASHLVFRLLPYFNNFGKRMVKSPKLYFTDVGLACYLLGIETENQMNRDPLRGKLFENLVLLELIKARLNQGRDPQIYYYRDKSQLEVDAVFQAGDRLLPIEIKSSQTFNAQFVKNLDKFKAFAADKVQAGYVVYAGHAQQKVNQYTLLNYRQAACIVSEL